MGFIVENDDFDFEIGWEWEFEAVFVGFEDFFYAVNNGVFYGFSGVVVLEVE